MGSNPGHLTLAQHVRLWTPAAVGVAAGLLTAGAVWAAVSLNVTRNTLDIAALELRADHQDVTLADIRTGQGIAKGERSGMQITLNAILRKVLED